MSASLIDELRSGKAILGFNLMYPAEGIIEGLHRDWDWVWIDMQHGQHEYRSALTATRTAREMGMYSILRPDTHDALLLAKYADSVPDGMMIPMIHTPEEAARVVRALRFPPNGARSFGGRRPSDLGGREYARESSLLIMPQIETPHAVTNARDIAATDGVDALFFGPDDLKMQLGLPRNASPADCPALRDAMEKTARGAHDSGKLCGCPAITPETLRLAVDMGYRILVGGSDTLFLRTLSAERSQRLRETLADVSPENASATRKGEGAY